MNRLIKNTAPLVTLGFILYATVGCSSSVELNSSNPSEQTSENPTGRNWPASSPNDLNQITDLARIGDTPFPSTFSIQNPSTLAVKQELVATTLGLPRGVYPSTTGFGVVTRDGSGPLDAVFITLNRYPDQSLRMIRVLIRVDLAAGERREFKLVEGDGVAVSQQTFTRHPDLAHLSAIRSYLETPDGKIWESLVGQAALRSSSDMGAERVLEDNPFSYAVFHRDYLYERGTAPSPRGHFLAVNTYLMLESHSPCVTVQTQLANDFLGLDSPIPGREADPNLYPLGPVRFRGFSQFIEGSATQTAAIQFEEVFRGQPARSFGIRGATTAAQLRLDLFGYHNDGSPVNLVDAQNSPMWSYRFCIEAPSISNENRQQLRDQLSVFANTPLIGVASRENIVTTGMLPGRPHIPAYNQLQPAVEFRDWVTPTPESGFGEKAAGNNLTRFPWYTHTTGTPLNYNQGFFTRQLYQSESPYYIYMSNLVSAYWWLRETYLFGMDISSLRSQFPNEVIYMWGSIAHFTAEQKWGRQSDRMLSSPYRNTEQVPYEPYDIEHFAPGDNRDACLLGRNLAACDQAVHWGEVVRGLLLVDDTLYPTSHLITTTARGLAWATHAALSAYLINQSSEMRAYLERLINRTSSLFASSPNHGLHPARPVAGEMGHSLLGGLSTVYAPLWQQGNVSEAFLKLYDTLGNTTARDLAKQLIRTAAWGTQFRSGSITQLKEIITRVENTAFTGRVYPGYTSTLDDLYMFLTAPLAKLLFWSDITKTELETRWLNCLLSLSMTGERIGDYRTDKWTFEAGDFVPNTETACRNVENTLPEIHAVP